MLKRNKFIKILVFLIVLFVLKNIANYLGFKIGEISYNSKNNIVDMVESSLGENTPKGFGEAKWLMSTSQVKKIYPELTQTSINNLHFKTIFLNRYAVVTFIFREKLLNMIVITFMDEVSQNSYMKTQENIHKKYKLNLIFQKFTTKELLSDVVIDMINITHRLYTNKKGRKVETVVLFITKKK